MSELINNSQKRKEQLKELILKIHNGAPLEEVRAELEQKFSEIPYGEVVEVEQELIADGLPETEIVKLCDVHSSVLKGKVSLNMSKVVPPGHPVDVFKMENIEIAKVITKIKDVLKEIEENPKLDTNILLSLRGLYNQLYDVDKHYQRKENLVFPYLEQAGITGPPAVMWGKHDEIRDLIKGSIELLQTEEIEKEEFEAAAKIILKPAIEVAGEMIPKEEEILFPMCLDKLADTDWYEISKQSIEIGFCLYDPPIDWKPKGVKAENINEAQKTGDHIQLPSGAFTPEELMTILNTLPFDMTFVDRNDKVKYFTQGEERVFQRNRAILNRDVRQCHPPSSTHIVDKIIEDFKLGKQSRAPFWINMGGQMIYIEYFALRSKEGEYLGTIEVSHNITPYRELEGEQRILSYK